jgi:hypothetical protein
MDLIKKKVACFLCPGPLTLSPQIAKLQEELDLAAERASLADGQLKAQESANLRLEQELKSKDAIIHQLESQVEREKSKRLEAEIALQKLKTELEMLGD